MTVILTKGFVRASIDAAIAKYGDEGEAACKAMQRLDPMSVRAWSITRSIDPGEEMMAWYREHGRHLEQPEQPPRDVHEPPTA